MRRTPKLGQHFLHSRAIIRRIAEEADLSLNETVLEIGPGKGVLTEELLRHVARVIAVEKDPALIKTLEERFYAECRSGKLTLVHGDVRDAELETLGIADGSFVLIANIPYYITGEILRRFLGGPIKPTRAVLLVQKEVAERIARSKKESILSLSVKAYGNPHYGRTVLRRYFSPPPRVDSAILRINTISKRKHLGLVDEEFFFRLIKKGFANKRKLLISNLGVFRDKKALEAIFHRLSLSEKARAEDLSFSEWKALAFALSHPSHHLSRLKKATPKT